MQAHVFMLFRNIKHNLVCLKYFQSKLDILLMLVIKTRTLSILAFPYGDAPFTMYNSKTKMKFKILKKLVSHFVFFFIFYSLTHTKISKTKAVQHHL